MSPRQPQSNASTRIRPRSEKSLALPVALFLSLVVFVVFAGEAGAEEQTALPTTERCATPTGTAPCPLTVRPSAVDKAPARTTTNGVAPAGPVPLPQSSVPLVPGFEPGPWQHEFLNPSADDVAPGPELIRAPEGLPPQGPPPEALTMPSYRHTPATTPMRPPDDEVAPADALEDALTVPGSGADYGPPATKGSTAPSPATEPPGAPYALRKDLPAGSRPPSAAPDKVPASDGVPTPPKPPVRSTEKLAPSAADRAVRSAADQTPSRVQGSGVAQSVARWVVEPLVQQQALTDYSTAASTAASLGVLHEALTRAQDAVSETAASAFETLESWTANWLPSGELAQSPSGDTASDSLDPLVPSLPPLEDSSFFSLSGVGQVGPGGGLGLLLLGVLASLLILVRRDGSLSWISGEPPKPTSALLLPLERPG